MMTILQRIFELFRGVFFCYSELRLMGFKARVFNSDFILSKNYCHFSIHLHQGLEPYNSKFEHIITFNHDGACILIEFHDRRKVEMDEEKIKNVCQNFYDYGGHLFLFDTGMEFVPKDMKRMVKNIESYLVPLP